MQHMTTVNPLMKPESCLKNLGIGYPRRQSDPWSTSGSTPWSSASASASARCRPLRPASCSSCVRQEKPSARSRVSGVAARTAGSSCSSAQVFDTS